MAIRSSSLTQTLECFSWSLGTRYTSLLAMNLWKYRKLFVLDRIEFPSSVFDVDVEVVFVWTAVSLGGLTRWRYYATEGIRP